MSLFISRFIYCNSISKRQTSIILGPDPKGPCGQSELVEARHWQESNPRPADQEAGIVTINYLISKINQDNNLACHCLWLTI